MHDQDLGLDRGQDLAQRFEFRLQRHQLGVGVADGAWQQPLHGLPGTNVLNGVDRLLRGVQRPRQHHDGDGTLRLFGRKLRSRPGDDRRAQRVPQQHDRAPIRRQQRHDRRSLRCQARDCTVWGAGTKTGPIQGDDIGVRWRRRQVVGPTGGQARRPMHQQHTSAGRIAGAQKADPSARRFADNHRTAHAFRDRQRGLRSGRRKPHCGECHAQRGSQRRSRWSGGTVREPGQRSARLLYLAPLRCL